MSSAQVFTRFLGWLASPLGVFTAGTLFAALAALLGRLEPRWVRSVARWTGVACAVQLAVFAWYPAADALAAPLERAAAELARERPAGAITGAAVDRNDTKVDAFDTVLVLVSGGRPVLAGEGSADRLWTAAELWRHRSAGRVLIVDTFTPDDAAVSRNEPWTEAIGALGVPARSVQVLRASRSDAFAAAAKGNSDASRLALVTSAFAMPRAVREAAQAGVQVSAVPTDYRAMGPRRLPQERWLPTAAALDWSTLVIKEWLLIGLARLRAWLEPMV